MKSQRRAGEPPAEVPGASIEAYFKPLQIMVDGPPGIAADRQPARQPQRTLSSARLAAGNPAQAKQALEQVDVQVASLRANVTRLPQPLAGMIDKVAKDAAGDANASSIAQISDDMAQDVTGSCQQVVANRYPFSKSDRDVPMADFAKIFAPGGAIDKFFSANLEPLVNRSGKTWVWKPNPNPSRRLSESNVAPVPAGGRNPRRVLSDRRQRAERVAWR